MTNDQPEESTLDTAPEPERLAFVVRVGGTPDRFVLVRTREDEPPRLLEMAAPGSPEQLGAIVADALLTRLGVEPGGPLLISNVRRPQRAARWREGLIGTGWVRAVTITTADEPTAYPPLTNADALPLDDASAALATSLERTLLRDGVELLEEPEGG